MVAIPGRILAEAKPQSTSTSREFIVYGADVRVRGAICDLAEAAKANLLRLLRMDDNWKTPLLINLDYPQANLPELSATHLDFAQTGFGLKIQLNLLVAGELNSGVVQRELLRAVLIEMMYRLRADVAAGTPFTQPPDWLIDGVLQLAPGPGRDESAKLLETMVAAKKIAPLEEVVSQKRELLDASSRRIHDASSMALVQLLIDSPDGRGALARFINDLPDAPNDQMADLQSHFPRAFAKSADTWWSSSVARLSARSGYEMLSAEETRARLDKLITFSIRDRSGTATTYTLNDYRIVQLPVSPATLRQRADQLLLLASQGHPLYRPIVQEYHQITALLAQRRGRNVGARLTRVAGYRKTIEHESGEIDDYMNWFEATQPKTMSGAFSQYSQERSASGEVLPRRRDPISVYLDTVEMQTE